jgi:hypothetical protein
MANEADPSKKSASYKEETGQRKLRSFLNNGNYDKESDVVDQNQIMLSQPVADLFPEVRWPCPCSVLSL